LPGRTQSIAEANADASVIVVATVAQLGSPEPDAPGQSYYGNAQATVVKVISGTLSGTFTFSFTVQTMPADIAEQPPVIGKPYLLFLRHDQGGYHALKMLAPTREHLAAVEALKHPAP